MTPLALNTHAALQNAGNLILSIRLGLATRSAVTVATQQLQATLGQHHAELVDQFVRLAATAQDPGHPNERDEVCVLLVDCWDCLVHAARSSTVESLAATCSVPTSPNRGAPSTSTSSGHVSRQSSGLSSHLRTFLSEKASKRAAMVGCARSFFGLWKFRANLKR
jgi:hypothetical protein